MISPVIEVSDLTTGFGDHLVLKHLDLAVRRGEILGVVGASGAGKSVLLSTLIGLKPPTSGVVRLFGIDLYTASEQALATVTGRWGVLFQGNALFSSLTVRENVSAPLIEHTHLPIKTIDQLADLKIALVGLAARTGAMKPEALSGGMLKRAGLARAIALDPDLLLLDEPTAGLDPLMAEEIDQLILDLRRTLGLTVVLISHDLDTLFDVCDRIAVLHDGRILAIGTPSEMRRSTDPWIHSYFDGVRGLAAGAAADRLASRGSGAPPPDLAGPVDAGRDARTENQSGGLQPISRPSEQPREPIRRLMRFKKPPWRLPMPSIHLPPGATQLVHDGHPTHPVLIDYEDGSRTRAISVDWNEDPAPAGTFEIEDERDVDAHGNLVPQQDADDGAS